MQTINPAAEPHRTYQDTVFRMLFSQPENAVELFNALEGTTYSPDTKVKFTTLEDAVYTNLKNDLGFIIKDKFLVLTEQQSTINNNMCLRQLEYIARTYEKLIPALELYGRKNVKIPVPEFFVVYTGNEKWEISQLRLSDSFLGRAPENSMELVVKIIKMRYNMGNDHKTKKILERSEKLCGYSTLLGYIWQYRKQGYNLKQSIHTAIGQCIREGILKDFLEKNSPEVGSMLFKEITSEEFAEIRANEAAEEFYEKGRLDERKQGILNLIKVCEDVKLTKAEVLKKLLLKYPMDKETALSYLEGYKE